MNWPLALINFLLSVAIIGLEIIYGRLHWLISDLHHYSSNSMSKEVLSNFVLNVGMISFIGSILSILSVAMSVIIYSKKICNRFIAFCLIVFAVLSFFVSFFVTGM